MNENTENQTEAPEENEQAAPEEKRFDLQSIDREYLGPDKIEEAVAKVEQIANGLEEHGLSPISNIPEDGIPDGYGMAIIPIGKREGGEVVTTTVVFAPVPDPQLIAEKDGGEDWIYSTLVNALLAKVANNARPKDGGTSGSIPYTIHDFITSQRGGGEDMAAWRKLGPQILKHVKEKSGGKLNSLNMAVFKQVLQSREFAESVYRSVNQKIWERVLDVFIEQADANGYNTAVLQHWKDTRDEVAIEEPELDLDDLKDL